ncbi:methylglyoxal reductase SakR1 [Thermosynechococcus sp. NK55a]|jgi:aryl-alcohol dehydrogenase-like predicted oxidoreductase|uniref:aldo/keto reductase n=1 Tax=unclassified Thermosynechococcus TaxID=2622553 RepID=UPI0003D955E9|nr:MULTISPECIES: aldo/keto reductase [unclassified Thermosynechococcus]AHB87739.1 methylglyoxal reductase SakR1 [Thermosynechococcus sp. NK55a]RMH67970.1 MAG: aldo/keto reductase [Cyanobacteria bacterium J003]HIK23587.1 aldo/keto reductase [Thermosynechococcus sp. M3746_W2019_013]
MQTRSLGRTEIQITPLILGTWQAGKRWWVGIEDEESIRTIRAAVEAGMTTIDTAEVYGEGHSERIVAAAVGDLRDRCVYATKVFANHLRYKDVIAACERSLRNLNTDYIDLYQIHWPAGSFGSEIVPIEETMQAMVELQAAGKIRAIGVSNFSRAQLAEAMQYGRIESVQPPYSLFWRWAEAELIPFCIEHEMTVLAYSPLAQGLLTGRFGPGHQFEPEDNRSKNQLFQGETYARALEAIELMKPIATSLGTTVGNLALAWLLHQPQTCAIVGARHPEQVLENIKAADLQLDRSILAMLDEISQPVIATLDPKNPVMWKW